MQDKQLRIIIVDDDPINNMICKKVIIKTIPKADIISFTEPEAGLVYLLSMFENKQAAKAILFLDINMPTITGWEFIDQLVAGGIKINVQLFIYILSSSVNPTDKEKAKINNNVVDYIEKPLSVEVVKSLALN